MLLVRRQRVIESFEKTAVLLVDNKYVQFVNHNEIILKTPVLNLLLFKNLKNANVIKFKMVNIK